MRVSKVDFKALSAKINARKSRRAGKIVDNGILKASISSADGPPRDFKAKKALSHIRRLKSPTMSKLKKILWDVISLIVRSWSKICWACGINPTYCAAHIVPSNDGATTRFFLPNLYPCCASCNRTEKSFRGSWVYNHKLIFGEDYVDALYEFSKIDFQVKRWWVLEQTVRMTNLYYRIKIRHAQNIADSRERDWR